MLGEEAVACGGDVGAGLLGGGKRLFLYDSFIRRSVFHRQPMLTVIFNSSATRVRSCSNVASGVCSTQPANCSRAASSSLGLEPPTLGRGLSRCCFTRRVYAGESRSRLAMAPVFSPSS